MGSTHDSSSGPVEWRITSHPSQIAFVRHEVEQFAARAGLGEAGVADMGLCVNEALANVIRHAYRSVPNQPILITAEVLPAQGDSGAQGEGRSCTGYPRGAVRVTIRDWGSGVNPASQPPKDRDPLQPGGIGLICLRHLMDETTYSPQPDGMLLTLVRANE